MFLGMIITSLKFHHLNKKTVIMEKIRYFILMALCVIGITSCQDDLTTGTAGADVNKPVKGREQTRQGGLEVWYSQVHAGGGDAGG